MTRTEAMKIVAILETNWSPMKDQEAAYDLWASSFDDVPYHMVYTAVMAYVQSSTSAYRPTVGQIREMMRDILYGRSMTETEAWLLVKGCFHEAQEGAETLRGAKSAWKKLPEDIQRLVTPRQLRDWNGIETEQLDTVIQSNFMRSFRELKNVRYRKEAMSKNLLETIERIQQASPVFEDHDKPKEALPAPEAPKYEIPAEWEKKPMTEEMRQRLAEFTGEKDE